MNIILEGPKACGKSTIAKMFIEEGYEYFHSSSETKNDLEYHLDLLDGDKRIIDRFSIGETIYPVVYKRESKLKKEEFLQTVKDKNSLIVLMYSSNDRILIDRITNRDQDFQLMELLISNRMFEGSRLFLKAIEGCNLLVFDIAKIENDAKGIKKEIDKWLLKNS